MKNKSLAIGLLAMLILSLTACRNRQLSPEEMQHKLDSIAKVEVKERLEAQGINLDREVSIVQLFYDSLNIQPLPIRYSDDYVKFLPGYKTVPAELASFMGLEGRIEPKAIALSETAATRLMILAADEGDGLYSLWLYSLDDEYMPVDKLSLYATSKEEAKENEVANPEDKLIQDFIITSDYEIRLTDWNGKLKAEMQRVYHIDPSRHFTEDNEIDYENEKPLY
jgi:hypothetical protein